MPRVTRSSSRLLLLLLALSVPLVVVAGCGSSDDGGDSNANAPAQPQPAANREKFPATQGRTLPDIIGNLPSGPVLTPSVSLLDKGSNRIGFALFDTAGKQLSGADVALYTITRPNATRASVTSTSRCDSSCAFFTTAPRRAA